MDSYQTRRDQYLLAPALAAAAAIQAELRALGWWSATAPSTQALADAGPFGQHTLTPGQWLQYILLERVSETARGEGHFPADSNVSTWSIREFDGLPEAHALQQRLYDFDQLFQPDLIASAAGWHPGLRALLAGGELDTIESLFAMPADYDESFYSAQLTEMQSVLNAGAEVDWHHPDSGLTALHVAIACGCDQAEQLLLQHGADPSATDGRGRNAFNWRMLRLQGRLSRILAGATGVRSARLAQLYFPTTQQFTTALVVLELDGPLEPSAFAALPATDPAVLMPLGGDAISQLARLAPPFWLRPATETAEIE